ncbi:Fic family protein [uncultured Veillonella sp.]|uniref:Fic family protein n=1 Tax=uncultured Veillonella sp. TaxID=159268 RepID=UPI0028057C37|nr:Fic family protein [uncultured Veillonella sp.]
MRRFEYGRIRSLSWDMDILSLIAGIYRANGKEEVLLSQSPVVLESLVELAKVQSTEASNAIEGIVTTSTRLRQLVADKTTPRNRDEQEIMGYRDALNIIHDSYDSIAVSRNHILQLHKILYQYQFNARGGQLKSVQNYISATYPDGHTEVLFTLLAPYETAEALDQICAEYNRVVGNGEVDPLLAIPIFIHDFLCIHPFNDGNGRMSRLLTTLLLYRSGFMVGKYVSLEAKIAANKDMYYAALRESSDAWYSESSCPTAFIRYWLQMVLAAYHDFEDRSSLLVNSGSAIHQVQTAIDNHLGAFTKQHIREWCPNLSDSAIEGAMRTLVKNGSIYRKGGGRSTYYVKA